MESCAISVNLGGDLMRKDNDRHQKKRAAAKRKAMRSALEAIGLWGAVQRTRFRTQLLDFSYPSIDIKLAGDMPQSDQIDALLLKAKAAVHHATFDCPVLGNDYSVRDYFRFVKAAYDFVKNAAEYDSALKESFIAAQQRLSDLMSIETASIALSAVLHELDDLFIRIGRIDETLYYASLDLGRKGNQKFAVSITIRRAPRRLRTFVKDGQSRPAFQCGQPFGADGLEWVSWAPEWLGLAADGPTLPVYVQSHVLDKLYRREKRAVFFEDAEWLIHDYLWQSLREPRIRPAPDSPEKLLVEYWLNTHHIGYLPASVMDNGVLVETFLFLTMDGTPEGKALADKLKLRRQDKKHLELDQIDTFLSTDLQFDPELVALLEECGCGHLFEISADPQPERCKAGYADAIRKHLRL